MNFAQLLALDPSSFRRRPHDIKYGLLYNWYATREQGTGVWLVGDDMRALNWDLPTNTDRDALRDYLISDYPEYNYIGLNDNEHGKALKESGFWQAGITDNVVDLNVRGTGNRRGNIGDIGIFQYIEVSSMITTKTWNGVSFNTTNAATWNTGLAYSFGYPIRPVRPATTAEQLLPDGILSNTYYYGNDGKVYRVTKIGTQVWVADNLAETKWSDGSWIQGYDGGTYTPITDANWAALSTAALCAYDDDLNNVWE